MRRLFFGLFAGLALGSAQAQSPLAEANKILSQPDLIAKPAPQRPKRLRIEYDPADVQPPRVETADGVFVGAISVEGASDLPASSFATAIEAFVGRRLMDADMVALCRAVADVARLHGYGFATAFIPPQALDLGMLKVTVDEGAVAEVRIKGTNNRQLRRLLARLAGAPAQTDTVEQQVMLAGDIPGITIQKVSFARENGRGILTVTATQQRVSGVASLDTFGSDTLGPVRLNLSADVASLLVDGDVLAAAGVATPLKPKDLSFVVLKYALPVDATGTVLSVTVARGQTQPAGLLRDFQVRGKSYDLAMTITHPLVRSRRASLWLGGGIEYLTSSQSILGTPLNEDHLTMVSLTLNGEAELLHGKLRSELVLTHGLPWFNATRAGDPLASRENADGVFTKARFSADWTGPVYRNTSLRLAGVAQLASGALLSAQEIGLGGSSFGRAFDFSERSADNGVLALAELRTSFDHPARWIDWAQPYLFVDGGKVNGLSGASGGGTLMSAGGGMRTRVGTTFINLESAFPLNTERLDTGDSRPRINMQLMRAF